MVLFHILLLVVQCNLLLGCFLSLSVTDKSATPATTSITIPAAWSEIEVIRSIVSYCIPRFLGLNAIWSDGGAAPSDHSYSAIPAPPGPHPSAPISTFDEEPSEVAAATNAAAAVPVAAPPAAKKAWSPK